MGIKTLGAAVWYGATAACPMFIAFFDNSPYFGAFVEGISMQPVFNPEWDRRRAKDVVLLNRIWDYQTVKRGDVVVLTSPVEPKEILIKRVIGLEGDVVKTKIGLTRVLEEKVRIPKGYVWIEGDHPSLSKDSNMFGPVPLGLLFAKATHIIWPVQRWAKVESEYPKRRLKKCRPD